MRCNQYKGDFWPDAADLAQGRRVLHLRVDDNRLHLAEDENTGYLRPLTATGHFHAVLLRLNRPQLVAHRLAKHLQVILHEKVRLLEQQNRDLGETIAAQERYLAALRRQSRARR